MPDSTTLVFVGALTPQASAEILKEIFEQYGTTNDISIRGKNKSGSKREVLPYAFVTYQDEQSAGHALNSMKEDLPSYSKYFAVAEASAPKQSPPARKAKSHADAASAADNAKKAQTDRLLKVTAEDSNIVIQCPTTHADRLARYVTNITVDNQGEHLSAAIKGSYARKGETLLFVSSLENEADGHPARLVSLLSETAYVRHIIKKVYMIGNLHEGVKDVRMGQPRAEEAVVTQARRLIQHAKTDQKKEASEVVVRISTFPPRFGCDLMKAIEQEQSALDEDDPAFVKMSPTNESHLLSVIQIDSQSDDSKSMFITSISDAKLPKFGEPVADNVICRAQRKINEAFDRYRVGVKLNSPQSSKPLKEKLAGTVALDCGSSPGGWTMYLAGEVKCSKVYSVDPGQLADDVRGLDNVQHLQMRIERAIGVIAKEEKNSVGLWVSDMCLHDMGENVTWLLRSRADGILRRDAYFVFTLKCVRSKVREVIDRIVKEEVSRLDGIAEGVEILHLFSNRSGERTVVGRFGG